MEVVDDHGVPVPVGAAGQHLGAGEVWVAGRQVGVDVLYLLRVLRGPQGNGQYDTERRQPREATAVPAVAPSHPANG